MVAGWRPLDAIAVGGFSHPIIDALTHRDPKYWKNDAGFLWPFKTRLAYYTGIWDYRIDYGVLRPKPFEATCDVILTGLIWFGWQ